MDTTQAPAIPKVKVLNLAIGYPQANSFTSELEDARYACLNPPPAAVKAGQAIALSPGRVEIEQILAQLPVNWQPDLISVSSSLALTQNPPLPTGFARLNSPTVMKLTDSHHLERPLQNLIAYAQAVGCQYHWTTYNRQHIPFYRQAGLANVFWMPGAINIPTLTATPVPWQQKQDDLVFLGSRGPSHPYRERLLSNLEQSGIQITVKHLPYQASLQAYANAKIVFNCSLNGDFNRRVYETLMAGGFLLTDQLVPEAGLTQLFQPGIDLECYHSNQELREKVEFYLAHPELAEKIAAQGQAKMLKLYHPERLRQQFYDFLLKGETLPEAYLAQELGSTKYEERVALPAHPQSLPSSCPFSSSAAKLQLYEVIQELHRINAQMRVLCYTESATVLAPLLNTLPRIDLRIMSVKADPKPTLLQQTEKWQILVIETCTTSPQQICLELINDDRFSVTSFALLILAGPPPTDPTLNACLKRQNFVPLNIFGQQESHCWVFRNRSPHSPDLKTSLSSQERGWKVLVRRGLRQLKTWLSGAGIRV